MNIKYKEGHRFCCGFFYVIEEFFFLLFIKISKIDIDYPIIAIENPNPFEMKIPLTFSIVRYWGGDVNGYGNLSIAGHNKIVMATMMILMILAITGTVLFLKDNGRFYNYNDR